MRKKRSGHFNRASWNPSAAPPVPQSLMAGAGVHVLSTVLSAAPSPAPSTNASPVVNTFSAGAGSHRG
jgi:hypothetical protein